MQCHGITMTEILATHRPEDNLMESLMCIGSFPLHILLRFNRCSKDNVRGAWFGQGVAKQEMLVCLASAQSALALPKEIDHYIC